MDKWCEGQDQSLTVSVIIPTWNRDFCLERAILSVLKQTYQKREIVVIDDGSTDGTGDLVAAIQHRFPGTISLHVQPNKGVAAARNAGIVRASGSLLAFLDSDDHWQRVKLARQVALMEAHPDSLVCHTREKWLRRGRYLNQKKIHIPRAGDIFDHCLQLCGVGMSTVMVRRELFEQVGLFDESFPCCEDYEFWLRVSGRYPFLLLDEPLTVKEGGREDQLSSQYRLGMDRFRIRALCNLLESHELPPEKRLLALDQLRKKCGIYGNGCLKHGKIKEGKAHLRLADQYEE